jgi:1-acylglycerone phosphate reductase
MPFLDTDLTVAKRLFETNFFGRIAITQVFAPLLIQSKATIVNIGSISGVCPTPYTSIYNASCAAVHQWSDTLRLELAPFDVRVVLVNLYAYRFRKALIRTTRS